MRTITASVDGDHTSIDVRLVVAPSAGVFVPAEDLGRTLRRGAVLGHIRGPGGSVPVRAFCDGQVMGLMREEGERLQPGQPVAWLAPPARKVAT